MNESWWLHGRPRDTAISLAMALGAALLLHLDWFRRGSSEPSAGAEVIHWVAEGGLVLLVGGTTWAIRRSRERRRHRLVHREDIP